MSSQVLQWDQTTPWSSLTPPTTESRYLTSMDRTGGTKVTVILRKKHFWFRFWLGGYGNGEGEFDCLAGVAVNRIGQFIIADR